MDVHLDRLSGVREMTMTKTIKVSRETATNKNGEFAYRSIRREAAQMALDEGRPVRLECEGKLLDVFQPT